jgi:hypothetical protein
MLFFLEKHFLLVLSTNSWNSFMTMIITMIVKAIIDLGVSSFAHLHTAAYCIQFWLAPFMNTLETRKCPGECCWNGINPETRINEE